MQFIAAEFNSDSNTIAVVECSIRFSDPELVLMAIKCAVVNWGRTTIGKSVLYSLDHNFNFGDLDLHQQDADLVQCLADKGVDCLTVTTTPYNDVIDFNINLTSINVSDLTFRLPSKCTKANRYGQGIYWDVVDVSKIYNIPHLHEVQKIDEPIGVNPLKKPEHAYELAALVGIAVDGEGFVINKA